MDAIAGLAFGIVVIDVIRRMGVDNDDAVAVDVLGSGVLTGLLMAVIYVVTILMGTQSRGLFEISDNGGIAPDADSRGITSAASARSFSPSPLPSPVSKPPSAL